MEKKVKVLFYKNINGDGIRAFIDKENGSGKSFNLVKMNEYRIEQGDSSLEEKRLLKEEVMVHHYLSLLQYGYSYSQILDELNNAVLLSEIREDMSGAVIMQLEDEKRYLESANSLFQLESSSYGENVNSQVMIKNKL